MAAQPIGGLRRPHAGQAASNGVAGGVNWGGTASHAEGRCPHVPSHPPPSHPRTLGQVLGPQHRHKAGRGGAGAAGGRAHCRDSRGEEQTIGWLAGGRTCKAGGSAGAAARRLPPLPASDGLGAPLCCSAAARRIVRWTRWARRLGRKTTRAGAAEAAAAVRAWEAAGAARGAVTEARADMVAGVGGQRGQCVGADAVPRALVCEGGRSTQHGGAEETVLGSGHASCPPVDPIGACKRCRPRSDRPQAPLPVHPRAPAALLPHPAL